MAEQQKKKFTKKQLDMVSKLSAVLSQKQIADFWGVCEKTVIDWCQIYPELRAAISQGKANAIKQVGGKLLTKAKAGDTTCMLFYLKTQAGWRETNRYEHTGKDGEPIKTENRTKLDLSNLSTEDLLYLENLGIKLQNGSSREDDDSSA